MIRDYQKKAHELIYKSWANKGSPLLVLPTGAGKSFTVMELIRQCHQVYNFVLVVRKRNLVEQLEKDAIDFNINYSVLMNGIINQENAALQIASIDTIVSRKIYPHIKSQKTILFIDEADESNSPGYTELITAYKNAGHLIGGMTATPYNGLSHFSEVIAPITAKELLAQGVLVPYRYWYPKGQIDLSDVDIHAGEYNQEQVKQKLDKKASIEDTIQAWAQFGDNRLTLLFCSQIEHSKKLVEAFNAFYGKEIARHVDKDTSKEERQNHINDFRNGKFFLLSNVGLFTRGTNIIEIGCILDCAPTLQMNKHIQKMGRGSRSNPVYPDCLYIDMVGNTAKLGPFYMDRLGLINLKRPLKFDRTLLDSLELMRRCEKCFGAFEPKEFKEGICPRCAHINKKKVSVKKSRKVDLSEVDESFLEMQTILKEFKKLRWQYRNLPGYKRQYINRQSEIEFDIQKKLVDKYGAAILLKMSNRKMISLRKGVICPSQ